MKEETPMTEVPHAATNGTATPSVRERVANELRAAIAELAEREAQIAAQLAVVKQERQALERSLRPLTDEPTPTQRKPGATRTVPSKVGPERLAEVEAAIRQLAVGDGEFRQADVVKATGFSSSVITNAFGQLLDADPPMIRLARVQRGFGGGKFFRLTRPALRESPPPGSKVASVPPPIRPAKVATRERVLTAIREHDGAATFAAIKAASELSDVAVRNAVHALVADGEVEDAGTVPRADGRSGGKLPHAYQLPSAG